MCVRGLHTRDAWSRQWCVSVQEGSTELAVCNR